MRSSCRDSFPTGVRGSSSTKSTAAGSSCLPSLPVRKVRNSSSVNGLAHGRSVADDDGGGDDTGSDGDDEAGSDDDDAGADDGGDEETDGGSDDE